MIKYKVRIIDNCECREFKFQTRLPLSVTMDGIISYWRKHRKFKDLVSVFIYLDTKKRWIFLKYL